MPLGGVWVDGTWSDLVGPAGALVAFARDTWPMDAATGNNVYQGVEAPPPARHNYGHWCANGAGFFDTR